MTDWTLERVAPSEPLRDKIVHIMTAAMLDGRLRPGDKISENDLCQQLGVSRAPVREAIRILVQKGMVVTKPRSGTYVTDLSLEDIEDGYRLRAALEEFALTQAFHVLSREDWDRLCHALGLLLGEMRDLVARGEDIYALTRLDLDWHTLHVDAAQNALLSLAWRSLGLPLRFMAGNGYYHREAQDWGSSLEHHERLLEELESHDLKRVQAAVRLHCLRRVRPLSPRPLALDERESALLDTQRSCR